ncbi:MAG: Glycosyl transferase family 2 [Nitrospira sp.]|nr:MAG: Glycosyl transferase family 2 [Nitrospira sp.]
MFDLVVAVNNEQTLATNLLRSPLLNNAGVSLQLQRGYRSASAAYNAALSRCENELVIFVHQDVYIPAEWENAVLRNISCLNGMDPDWAVLGVYGVMGSGTHIGHVWSSGLNKVLGSQFDVPVPVESLDELLIIVKRSSCVTFDDQLPGYHLYATDLVQTAKSRAGTAYAICAPVIHNSLPSLYQRNDYFEAYQYVARKWKAHLPIVTCVAPITRSLVSYLGLRLRHRMNEWRYRNVNRQDLDRCYDPLHIAKQLNFE